MPSLASEAGSSIEEREVMEEATLKPSAMGQIRGQVRVEFGIPDNFELDISVVVPLEDRGTVKNISEIGVCLRKSINGITATLVRKNESGSWHPMVELAKNLTRQGVQTVLRNAQNSLNWDV